jgi:arylsulfatase A-like enzyme
MGPRPGRTTALALAMLAALGCGAPGAPRPNVVWIVLDDLGWDDLGAATAPDLRTPHLDTLAAEGVRFTSAYSPAPVCSPARAGMLTGRYPQRFGHEHNTGSIGRQQEGWIGLPADERTIGDVMREAGYATGFVGKWHLGVRQEYHPQRRGFDEFFGFLPGHHAYHHWNAKAHNPILRGFDRARGDEYLTDAFSREAVAFVARHADRPFFLILSFSAVHEPLVTDPARLERMDHLPPGPRRDLAAVLAAADDGVGRLDEALEGHGIADRTLVLVTSDNGAARAGGLLRGDKASLYEAGIRVPLLARWPERLPAGAGCDDVVSTLDLFATTAAAAGVGTFEPQIDGIDGVDLTPRASGASQETPHDVLFWRMGEQHAMREHHWKLHWRDPGSPALYDLHADPAESRDLASAHPARAGAMRERYAEWAAQMIPPRWEWLPGQPGETD